MLRQGYRWTDLENAHLFGLDGRKRGGKSARQNERFRLGGNVQNFLKGALRAVGALILLAGGDAAGECCCICSRKAFAVRRCI